jgi:transmembrane sensor
VISAGDRVIEMRSGEINLLRQTTQRSAKTVLTILAGTARIYPEDRAAEGIDAAPDQEISWTDGQAQPDVRTVNAANAVAWESHRLAYDKAPLSEVVADLNRYVARPIRIADPTLGALHFSGVLTLQGEDVMLRTIAAALPVEAKPMPAEIVLQRPTPKPVKPKRKPNALMQSLLKLNRDKPEPSPPRRTP